MVAPFSYFLLVLIQEQVLGYMSSVSLEKPERPQILKSVYKTASHGTFEASIVH